jgi:hypothetical protein
LYPIPIIAQQLLAGDAVAGRPTPWWAFIVAGVSAVVISVALMLLTTRLLQRERIIFTR